MVDQSLGALMLNSTGGMLGIEDEDEDLSRIKTDCKAERYAFQRVNSAVMGESRGSFQE